MIYAEDTIAAVATAPGEGGIAILRLSGPACCAATDLLLRTRAGDVPRLVPRQATYCLAVDPGRNRTLDEVLAIYMPGPASYTGEDVLEVQSHGGHAVAHGLLDLLLTAQVARLADPGEFTLRAFLRGRLDLVQAEAVLDLIRSRTRECAEVHEELLGGRLSQVVVGWQEELLTALVDVEVQLDFSEEEDAPDFDARSLAASVQNLADRMQGKLGSYAWGRTQRDGLSVALLGSPNSGKSSLLNAFLDEERAIVSEEPGTTRDVIDAWANVYGLPLRFVDTAGLRDTESSVELAGMARAVAVGSRADLILYVADGSRPLSPREQHDLGELPPDRVLVVLNKSDLGQAPAMGLEGLALEAPSSVSALHGDGIDELLRRICSHCFRKGPSRGEAPLTRARHQECVREAVVHLTEALDLLKADGLLDLVAAHLHAARAALALLLGWGTPEDVLDRIFGEFCVGK